MSYITFNHKTGVVGGNFNTLQAAIDYKQEDKDICISQLVQSKVFCPVMDTDDSHYTLKL